MTSRVVKTFALIALALAIAATAALVTRTVTVAAPLFMQPAAVPSVAGSAPPPQFAAAVDRARELARAAILEQNLPGVSVAVAAGGTIVWAEGFGWRDVDSRTPVTPGTRFNVGTAAPAVAAAAGTVGLANTGAEEAAAWSPEHVGEPEEDFPFFTLVRDVVFRPLGIAPAQPLPGDRATFYVPRSDDNNPRRGRRPMRMRDLACCAGDLAFYSTPSDLVRFALATNADSLEGDLAGGRVVSLTRSGDQGVVVAVASNIAHAGTSVLAQNVADAFAGRK